MNESAPPIRVLLIEDHVIVRQGLVSMVSAHGYAVVGETAMGSEGIELYKSLRPDLVILDLNLPDMPGLAVLAELLRRDPDARVCVFSLREQVSVIAAAYRAGALAYVPKSAHPDELLRALEFVVRGEKHFLPGMQEEIIRFYSESPLARINLLSEMEIQILTEVGNGKTADEIAGDLGLNRKTISNHITNVCRVLQCERSDLYRIALEQGLVIARL